jgi:hypothetical protein
MRILLIITVSLLVLSGNIFAQNNFVMLDKETNYFYSKGDLKNLGKTADTLFSKGIDYYYLRFRLGMLAYNKQLYSIASENLTKAIEFNSMDTISRECIYYSYLLSGRKADASLYLKSLPEDKKNVELKSLYNLGLTPTIYMGFSDAGYNATLYEIHKLYYEAVKSSLGINAGIEGYFSDRFRGTITYTSFQKTETVYSAADTLGRSFNFTQNQIYAKLDGYLFPGWEFSVFDHSAFYSDLVTQGPPANRQTISVAKTEYNFGVGFSKNGWKVRTGANFSLSNFSNANQVRGEAYLTYLPSGNLNFYSTTGAMYQADNIWGSTYQVNEEIGLKIYRFLWLEAGLIKGNSFLYARNQGSFINNSLQEPAITIYGNIIILSGNHLTFTVTPFYVQNYIYSWNLTTYTRSDKLVSNLSGASIKITYKFK